jgi:RNA polymerase sigma factor (TIGR02999 family)
MPTGRSPYPHTDRFALIMESHRDVTALLQSLRQGDQTALDRLFPLVYGELRRVAHRQLAREREGHTLDSVALVNETYLKLAGADIACENRSHFFAVAARAMRTILIDYARARLAAKRGNGVALMPLEEATALFTEDGAEHLLALNEALGRLEAVNEEACRTVECRYFAGLSLEEAAEALDTSVATVRRRWSFAKAWLRRELEQAS